MFVIIIYIKNLFILSYTRNEKVFFIYSGYITLENMKYKALTRSMYSIVNMESIVRDNIKIM